MSNAPDILKFQGEYRWLSNFAPVKIYFDGDMYSSTEHAYQAAKTLDPKEREAIRMSFTPGKAKRLGNQCTKRADWDSIKNTIMFILLIQKYSQDPYHTQLIATQDAHLEEGNTWGDTYWGTVNRVGENWLGRLTMQVRDELWRDMELDEVDISDEDFDGPPDCR